MAEWLELPEAEEGIFLTVNMTVIGTRGNSQVGSIYQTAACSGFFIR